MNYQQLRSGCSVIQPEHVDSGTLISILGEYVMVTPNQKQSFLKVNHRSWMICHGCSHINQVAVWGCAVCRSFMSPSVPGGWCQCFMHWTSVGTVSPQRAMGAGGVIMVGFCLHHHPMFAIFALSYPKVLHITNLFPRLCPRLCFPFMRWIWVARMIAEQLVRTARATDHIVA